ncbi:MAG: 16S rRNA (adenine(1518)-N(6)/adenine(1519)-N(6))-dimethyltransferase RsmA [Gammaproteobacteria bacterium]
MIKKDHLKRPALPKAKKALGQHFLKDQFVVDALLDMMHITPDDTVIEVGPGPGILTHALARTCKRVMAIELDRDMVHYLSQHLNEPNVHVHHGDILHTHLSTLIKPFPAQGVRIVSNLPYQISSPFLFHLVNQLDHITEIGLMLQKEVVERLIAPVGSAHYGRLSVMMQFYFQTQDGPTVPPSAFIPPPRVDSALITLTPKPLSTAERGIAHNLGNVVKHAFSQRRKTVKNTLKPLFSIHELDALGVDPGLRAEKITVTQFVSLAHANHEKDKIDKIDEKEN